MCTVSKNKTNKIRMYILSLKKVQMLHLVLFSVLVLNQSTSSFHDSVCKALAEVLLRATESSPFEVSRPYPKASNGYLIWYRGLLSQSPFFVLLCSVNIRMENNGTNKQKKETNKKNKHTTQACSSSWCPCCLCEDSTIPPSRSSFG